MKRTTFLTTLLIGSWLGTTAFALDTYKIDPAHSRVGFAVTHMVINTVKGDFREFSGTVGLENNQVREAKGTIEVKSVNTGVDGRDKHLKSPDFFDLEKYPTITFESKHVEKKGDGAVLVGDFAMHGVTNKLSMPVTIKGPIKDSFGNSRIGIEAKAKVSRKDYGMKFNRTMGTGDMIVSDEVEIEINAEAVLAK